MNIGELIATLGVDTSSLRQSDRQVKNFTSNAESAFSRVEGAASSCSSQILGMVGVALSVAGAFALASKALSTWYSIISEGIGKVEKFKSEMISTSYLLAAQSEVPKPDLGKAYQAWGEYYLWMKQQALEADKAAASGMEDIMAVATQLLKKGVKAENLEEFNVIARLTDVMKGAIPGYANLAMQARGEIEAILTGTNRMGAQTAMILSGIDSEFKKNMASARAAGKELEYFNSLLPKIEQYTRDMMGTLDAVTSSLRAAYSVVQVKAFGDAHKDVVKFIGDLGNKLVENGKLTATGEMLALELGQAWSRAKESIAKAVDYMLDNFPQIVTDIGNVVSALGSIASTAAAVVLEVAKLVNELGKISQDPALMTILGAALGSRAGPYGALVGGAAGLAYSSQKSNAAEVARGIERNRAAAGVGPGGEAAESFYLPQSTKTGKAPPTPKIRKSGGGAEKGGGGKGLESAQRQLENFIQTMEQTMARASGDSYAAMDEWYRKQVITLKRLEEQVGYSEAAHTALEQAKYDQLKKLDRDYFSWYAKESGDKIQGVIIETNESLAKYGNTEERRRQIQEIGLRKIKEIELERQSTIMSVQQQTLQAMASATPFLSQQLDLQGQILSKENEMALLEIQRKELKGEITQSMASELLGLQALTNQAKLYAYERSKWETQGVVGGLKIAGVESENTALTYTAKATASYLQGLPQEIGSGIANWMVATMKGEKQSFEDLGWSMAQKFIETTMTGFANQIMPYVIKGLESIFGGLFGGSSPGAGMDWDFMYSGGAYHSGGIIRAHKGWPSLRSDEVPIIAQTGERVLSRRQNAAFESGMFSAPQVNVIVNNNSPNTQASAEQSPEGDIIVTIDDLTSKAYARRGSLFKMINSNTLTRR